MTICDDRTRSPPARKGARISPSPHAKPHQRRKNVAHGARRGITAHREHAEPRSGDRRCAIIKTALSPLPGLFRRIGPAFSPRLSPWATFLRPPRRAPEAVRVRGSVISEADCDQKLSPARRHRQMKPLRDDFCHGLHRYCLRHRGPEILPCPPLFEQRLPHRGNGFRRDIHLGNPQ